jgi:hypothetical protein
VGEVDVSQQILHIPGPVAPSLLLVLTEHGNGVILPPPQALVASWKGHTHSGERLWNLVKKNGAGVTSASIFIYNLEYKQAIKKA